MKLSILPAICIMSLSATTALANDAETKTFIQKAAISNTFEIESSKLALEKSQNAKVKAFANQMIKDHQKAGANLKQAVAEAKLDGSMIPTNLDKKHQRKMDKLRGKSGENFDAAYMDMQEDAHDKAVDLFEDYSENEDQTGPVKTFAANTLPTLERHEERSDDLQDEVGSWWDWD